MPRDRPLAGADLRRAALLLLGGLALSIVFAASLARGANGKGQGFAVMGPLIVGAYAFRFVQSTRWHAWQRAVGAGALVVGQLLVLLVVLLQPRSP